MKNSILGLICGLLGLALLFWTPAPPTPPAPVERDLPAVAFATYESLWRDLAKTAADKLADGELKTDKDVWKFLATGQVSARKLAFEELAKSEQDYFDAQGGWTPELHEKLLRSYVK